MSVEWSESNGEKAAHGVVESERGRRCQEGTAVNVSG